MAWATSSLPVPDSPRTSTVVLACGHLGHLLVDRLHGPAAAHDVADVVALGELAPQLGVLVEEALSLRLDEVVDAHRLADHRAHHPEELGLLVVAAVLLVGQGHPERAHRPVLGPDRHADVGHLVPARAAEDPRAVEEEGLAADLGHHHRSGRSAPPVPRCPRRGGSGRCAPTTPPPLAASTARSPASSSCSTMVAESVPRLSSRIASTRWSAARRFSVPPRVWLTSRRSDSWRGSAARGGTRRIMTEMSARVPTRPTNVVGPGRGPRPGSGLSKEKPKRGRGGAAAERARVIALNQPWAITW